MASEPTGRTTPVLVIERQPIGPRLGRYEVGELIGRGGMGAVYRALDPQLGRPVAIKVLAASMVSGSDRLLAEAQAMAKLSHPNVVTVYEAGVDEGRVYIAMELVAGVTARTHFAKPRPWREVLKVYTAVGRGLAAAHRAGIVHRDFKPDNVLVGDDGRARVVDFGLASSAGDTQATSASPEAVGLEDTIRYSALASGTPAYMAPEQYRHEPIDARADQFAFCVALHEALHGVRPFAGKSFAELRRNVLGETAVTPPADRRVPAWVRAVVKRGLAIDPGQRHPSMDALVAALERDPAARRRRAGVVLALLASGGVAAFALLAHPRQRALAATTPWRPVIRELPPAFDENSDGVSLSPDGKMLAYDSDRSGTFRIYVAQLGAATDRPLSPSGTRAQARPSFTSDSKAVLFAADNDIYRQPLAGGPAVKVVTDSWRAVDCAGRLVFERAPPSVLWLRERDGHERVLARLADSHAVRALSCSRQGDRIMYADQDIDERGAVFALALDGAAAPVKVIDKWFRDDRPSFHPDGRSIFFTAERGGAFNLWELPLAGGPPRQITFGAGTDVSPVPTQDGRQLIYDLDNSEIAIYAYPMGGGPRRRVVHSVEDVTAMDVSEDGSQLVLSAGRAGADRIVLLDLADGHERVLADGTRPVFGRDGHDIVFVRGRRLLAVPRAGGTPRVLAEVPGDIVGSPLEAEDGIYAPVPVDGRRTVWRAPLSGGEPVEVVPTPGCDLSAPAFGGWTLCGRHDGLEMVPPGAAPDDRSAVPIGQDNWFTLPNHGPAVVFVKDHILHRLDFTTGAVTDVGPFGDPPVRYFGPLSPDGKTLYVSAYHGEIRRQIITNLGDLPRPP